MATETELIPISFAVFDPTSRFLAVSSYNRLRLFGLSTNELLEGEDFNNKGHTDTIRSIAFSSDGSLLASTGDDKQLKVWETQSLRLLATRTTQKKMTTVMFSDSDQNGVQSQLVIYADKFGDSYVGPARTLDNETYFLGHCSSTITSLAFTPDKKYIISADRDEKIRVTNFPATHEIESFCLGHTAFVAGFAVPTAHPALLVSAGGDGTVRLWQLHSGRLLHTELACPQDTNASSLAVTVEGYSPIHDLVAVRVEGVPRVLLYKVDETGTDGPRLLRRHTIALASPAFSAAFDNNGALFVFSIEPPAQRFAYDPASTQFVAADDALTAVVAQKGPVTVSASDTKNSSHNKSKKKPASEPKESLAKRVIADLSLEAFRKTTYDSKGQKRGRSEDDD